MLRSRLLSALAALAVAFAAQGAGAAEHTLRVGYQKYGTLVLLKARGDLDAALKPLGFDVSWTEFPAGPQLLEAMNAGAVDFGLAGEAPPIFAQAAGVPLAYVGNEPPAPHGEAILVSKNSPLRTVADLKGRSVALNKGSNVHYLLLRALEQAGVAYADIKPVFLAPADARAAFESGAVDAWAIWDPYLAAAQAATGARTLADGAGLVPNVQFYLATKRFAADNPKVIDAVLVRLDDVDRWAEQHPDEVAATVAPAIHLPAPIVATALQRAGYGVTRVSAATLADQQKVADAFAALKLLPRPVTIGDALVKPGL